MRAASLAPSYTTDRDATPKHMLGDKAYDSAELREELDERGTKPVPNRSHRKQPFSFNKRLYKLRWRIGGRLQPIERLQTHCNPVRQARPQLPGVRLSCRRPRLVDLVWWI